MDLFDHIKEDEEIRAANTILSSPNANKAFKAAAQDMLDRIAAERARRQEERVRAIRQAILDDLIHGARQVARTAGA